MCAVAYGALAKTGIIPAECGEAIHNGQLENADLVEGRVAIAAYDQVLAIVIGVNVDLIGAAAAIAHCVALVDEQRVDLVAVGVGGLNERTLCSILFDEFRTTVEEYVSDEVLDEYARVGHAKSKRVNTCHANNSTPFISIYYPNVC